MDKVIIIGSGMSGLVLANVLKLKGVPFQVFERDESPCGRSQGWSLNLHFGFHALREVFTKEMMAELPSEVCVKRNTNINQGVALVDGTTGNTILRLSSKDTGGAREGGDFYRVNRGRLRNWLLKSLGPDGVTWKKQVVGYAVLPAGGVEVRFEDGTATRGAMVVGADGVHSKICEQLMGVESFHRATTVNPVRVLAFTRWITEAEWQGIERAYAPQAISFGQSSDGEGVCLFTTLNDVDPEQHPEKPYQVLWSVSRYDEAGKLPPPTTPKERFEEAIRWINHGRYEVDFPFTSLVNNTPAEDVANMLAIVTRERKPNEGILCTATKETSGRVTLIGDAAHTMTTFRGEGGNHAILDAVRLGEALSRANQDQQTLEAAIQDYLTEMIPRGQKAVDVSHEAADHMHNSPDDIIKRFHQFGKQTPVSESRLLFWERDSIAEARAKDKT